MRIEKSLASIGVAPHAAAALAIAAARVRGMTVFCGPAGAGKTTLAQLLVATQRRTLMHWFGDLRMPDEISRALDQAERASVIAVVRSGQSRALRDRWADMGIAGALVDRAAVVTVTLRRLARTRPAYAPSSSDLAVPDALVLEILAPDGTALTGA